MNSRLIFMLLLAMVFAGFAALIAKNWINKKVTPETVATQAVVIAAADIPFGVKLEEVHVKTIEWPATDVPQGSFSNVDDVIGKIVKNAFYPGETITERRIVEHLGGSTLSSLVNENFRAISIRVDDVVGVAGFVLPGNRVDVLATQVSRRGSTPQAKTRTILENIKVLAVDQEASPDKEKPALVRAVTLELNPVEAEKLVESMQEGKIQLTLRNPLDAERLVRQAPKAKPRIQRTRQAALVVVPW